MSYRATIASSELQPFPAPQGPLEAAFVEAWEAGFQSVADQPSPALLHPADDAVPLQQFLCASLWFRPPPAA
jgi:hypothetical protein